MKSNELECKAKGFGGVTSENALVSYFKMIFRSKLAIYDLGIRPNYEKRILRKTAYESRSVIKS